MAKVTQLNIPPEWLPLLEKIMRWYDNLRYPVWCSGYFNSTRSSRARSVAHSYLQDIAELWNNTVNQADWNLAAEQSEMTGYNLFVKDQSYRIKNNIAGCATPSIHHQYTARKIMVVDNTGDNITAIFRRRHISNMPIEITISIKVNRTSLTGKVAVCGCVENIVRGIYFPTINEIIAIEGDADWATYTLKYNRFLLDRVTRAGIIIGFEQGFEGEIIIDNTRIKAEGVDEYTGWRQNAGTDDWQQIDSGAIITQEITYVE